MTNTVRIVIPALGLVLLTACLVALVLGRVGPFSDSDKRSGLATVADPEPASRASIPALDAAASARTETAGARMATFALG
jgi:hypothetical protein